MSISTSHIVMFREVDAAGIVFFARYFEISHGALEALLEEMDISLAWQFESAPWIMPLVHVESDYSRPIRLGEVITVIPRVVRVGKTSLHLAFDLTGAQGDLRARVQHIHAFVDRKEHIPCPVPKVFLAGLQKVELLDAQGKNAALKDAP